MARSNCGKVQLWQGLITTRANSDDEDDCCCMHAAADPEGMVALDRSWHACSVMR